MTPIRLESCFRLAWSLTPGLPKPFISAASPKINVATEYISYRNYYSTDNSWVWRTHKEIPSFEIRHVRVKQDEMYHRKFPRDVVEIESGCNQAEERSPKVEDEC